MSASSWPGPGHRERPIRAVLVLLALTVDIEHETGDGRVEFWDLDLDLPSQLLLSWIRKEHVADSLRPFEGFQIRTLNGFSGTRQNLITPRSRCCVDKRRKRLDAIGRASCRERV